MNEQPLFLLDVDGVTNAFDAVGPKSRWRVPNGYVALQACGYRITMPVAVPEWMREIEAAFGRGNCIHATMWQENVYELAAVAKYGQSWDYIDFDGANDEAAAANGVRTGAGVVGYKMPAIIEVIGDAPVVYIDDDMQPAHHAWAAERNARGIPTLFIQPDPAVGITREHIDEALMFAEMHGAWAAEGASHRGIGGME
jgi:hypothetical protein